MAPAATAIARAITRRDDHDHHDRDAVLSSELVGSVDALREAVESCRDGRHRASQALATVTLGAIVHDTLGELKFEDARRAV